MKRSSAMLRGSLAVAAVLGSTCGVIGQGLVDFFNTSSTLARTNSLGIGGTADATWPALHGFAYGLFIAPSTVTSIDPLDLLAAPWTFTGIYASNTAATTGGRLDGGASVAVPGWNDTTNSFVVAGWSANIAWTDWSTVAAQLTGASLTNGVWSGPNWLPAGSGGFFGVSALGFGRAPNPIHGRPGLSLFGFPSSEGTPVSTGFDLFSVNIPEPSSPALAAAGLVLALCWRMRHNPVSGEAGKTGRARSRPCRRCWVWTGPRCQRRRLPGFSRL